MLKVKILEAKYAAQLEFPKGGGGGEGVANQKNPPWVEYGYLLDLHIKHAFCVQIKAHKCLSFQY